MASAITIRAALEEDMPVLGTYGTRLMALHHQWDPKRFIATGTGTEASYARWLRSQLEKPDVVVLAAEQEKMIVGYAYASLEGYDYMALRGPAGVIHDLFVDPEKRNQGIGRMLLDASYRRIARARSRLGDPVHSAEKRSCSAAVCCSRLSPDNGRDDVG